MSDQANNLGDSSELEALFDSIIHAAHQVESSETDSTPDTSHAQDSVSSVALQDMAEPARSMFSHIGQMTRKLHDTLRELGLDKSLEKAASQIPDARDRLAYIATMTEQAAERTLNALDIAKPLQDRITESSRELSTQWNKLFANELSIDEFKALAEKTRAHLAATAEHSDEISNQMLDIMMAQDFQDLTGQVIKKVVVMAKDMEQHLLDFLLMFSPQGVKQEDTLLNGPVISPEGRTDVVTNQAQVDDLLDSLGF